MQEQGTVTIELGDMSGQRSAVTDIPRQASWGEAMNSILGKLSLPRNPADDKRVVWTGRLEREGRQLNASEIVGDALQDGDRVTIERDIQAGKTWAKPGTVPSRSGTRSLGTVPVLL